MPFGRYSVSNSVRVDRGDRSVYSLEPYRFSVLRCVKVSRPFRDLASASMVRLSRLVRPDRAVKSSRPKELPP